MKSIVVSRFEWSNDNRIKVTTTFDDGSTTTERGGIITANALEGKLLRHGFRRVYESFDGRKYTYKP